VGPVVSAARDRVLFEEHLLDSSAAQRKRRTWPTLISFVLQLFVIGLLLLLPLWFTDVLPKQQLLVFLEAPPPATPPPPAAVHPTHVESGEGDQQHCERAAARSKQNPAKVQMIEEEDAPPPVVQQVVWSEACLAGSREVSLGGVIGGIIGSISSLAAAPALSKPVPAVQRVRISPGVTQRTAHLSG